MLEIVDSWLMQIEGSSFTGMRLPNKVRSKVEATRAVPHASLAQ